RPILEGGESVEHVGDDEPGGHAAPFQTRPRMMCCMCLRWTPYSSASCAWVTPPASQRARISRTCSGVSLERLGGRYLTGCGVRARWRFARARRTSWYASTRAMTSRLVCAVRHAWSRRSWALARRRSMSRIGALLDPVEGLDGWDGCAFEVGAEPPVQSDLSGVPGGAPCGSALRNVEIDSGPGGGTG